MILLILIVVKRGNPEFSINSQSSPSVEESSDIQVMDISDSDKIDIDNHPNQNYIIDCDTNLKSVNMDDNQIPLEGADFSSYPSVYDELICVPNIYSDEHETLMRGKDWLTESLKHEIS